MRSLHSYLRTVQDWIIRPQLKGIARPGRRRFDRRLCAAISHRTRSPQAHRPRPILCRYHRSARKKQSEHRGRLYRTQWRGLSSQSRRPPGHTWMRLAISSSRRATACRFRSKRSQRCASAKRCAQAAPAENGREVVIGTAMMLIGANSRTVALAVDDKMQEDQQDPAPRHQCQDRAQPHQACRRHHPHRRQEPLRRGSAGHCDPLRHARQFPRRLSSPPWSFRSRC